MYRERSMVNTKNPTMSIVEDISMDRITNVGFFHGPLDIILRRKRQSANGKPIAIDEATQIKPRSVTTRVKVILDLVEKLPNHIRLQFEDGKSGKLNEGSLDYTLKCLDHASSLSTFNR
ncbi:hypothetical protein EJD97_023965 [Solanum chilense]|uniref:Uncharacterized protein n=1 Tax=Solanum chilense TaxID=4083 RepID=A0A6N2AD85_SOLCI|nr:hypothetical protein EJD97_023965 [Solanum chilense]